MNRRPACRLSSWSRRTADSLTADWLRFFLCGGKWPPAGGCRRGRRLERDAFVRAALILSERVDTLVRIQAENTQKEEDKDSFIWWNMSVSSVTRWSSNMYINQTVIRVENHVEILRSFTEIKESILTCCISAISKCFDSVLSSCLHWKKGNMLTFAACVHRQPRCKRPKCFKPHFNTTVKYKQSNYLSVMSVCDEVNLIWPAVWSFGPWRSCSHVVQRRSRAVGLMDESLLGEDRAGRADRLQHMEGKTVKILTKTFNFHGKNTSFNVM